MQQPNWRAQQVIGNKSTVLSGWWSKTVLLFPFSGYWGTRPRETTSGRCLGASPSSVTMQPGRGREFRSIAASAMMGRAGSNPDNKPSFPPVMPPSITTAVGQYHIFPFDRVVGQVGGEKGKCGSKTGRIHSHTCPLERPNRQNSAEKGSCGIKGANGVASSSTGTLTV